MDVQSLLRGAETDAEKMSAAIRLVVFVTLASVIFSADGSRGPAASIGFAIGIYGVGTIIGLVLAWRGIFHPVIPYLFVTFDVILVSAQILMLTSLMGMASTFAFALPAASLVFVILIHASMRYRPWLIAYAAGMFLVAITFGSLLTTQALSPGAAMSMMQGQGMGPVMNYQVLPVVLIALAAIILFVTSRRTRVLLLNSITQAVRADRLSRFFSPNLASRLADGDDAQLLSGRRLPAAVIFVDIRGFTTLGETMTPEELTEFLSDYRTRLTGPIFAYGETVDKFIGDAIMAVFGTPVQGPDDADNAVACALEMLDTARCWSQERERSGKPKVGIGMGLHFGDVFAGTLGSGKLLEYTVIGDTVNIAQRLEGISRNVGSPLVVSADLYRAASSIRQRADWRRLPPQVLRGHQKPIEAFCMRWHDDTPGSDSRSGLLT